MWPFRRKNPRIQPTASTPTRRKERAHDIALLLESFPDVAQESLHEALDRNNDDVMEAAADILESLNDLPPLKMCDVCLVEPRATRFNCGHASCCAECAHHIVASPTPVCPICRAPILCTIVDPGNRRVSRNDLQETSGVLIGRQSSYEPPTNDSWWWPFAAAAPQHAAARPQSPQAASSSAGFMPAPTFAGRRPGYIFQMGPSGVGYYRDALQPEPAAAPLAADAEEEEAPKGALPNAFFDDPQNDPANKGKEVARTNKEQSLNEELDAFNKEVEEDLKAADAADEEEEEDEEEGRLREEVAIAGALEAKMDGLKRKRAEMAERAAAVESKKGRAEAEAAVEEGDEDDDEEDDGALHDLLNGDWRAKKV